MKLYSYLTLIILLFLTLVVSAQCDESTTKMMVMGDSWAFFSWQGDSFNENLERFGYSDIKARSNIDISILGSKANNYFKKSGRRKAITDFIEKYPDLEVVHFSLGGNDILRAWHKNMSSIQEDTMLNIIIQDIRNAMEIIWSLKPSVHIHFSGYEYPNFAETVSSISPPWLQKQHPFYDLWDEMGKPTVTELNSLIRKSTQFFIDSVASHKNVSFVNNLGLMQWHYGQNKELKVNPFGTYKRYTAPVPGGYINYPTPLDALNADGFDSYHLNDNAYEVFIKRQFEEFYWSYFRNADTSFIGTPKNNGSVTDKNFSDSLILGNTHNYPHKTILTFNTSVNNTSLIKDASIFIQRSNLIGNNLIDEDLDLEIKSGHFGETIKLNLDDYNASSDAMANACVFGTLQKDDYWMRIDIPKSLLGFINQDGTTQFRLTYDISETNRNVTFINNTQSVFLDVKFDDIVTSTSPTSNRYDYNLILSPNPCSDFLNLSFDQGIIKHTEIFNHLGQLIHSSTDDLNQVDVSKLNKGLFYIMIYFEDKIISKTFIKQ